jgi:23S rRNA (guanosine2251-2'-O)-methyltransferase
MEEGIVFGLHAVKSLLKQRPQGATRLIVQKGRDDERVAEILKLARAANVPVDSRDTKELDRLSGAERHQGVCLYMKPAGVLGEGALDDLLDKLSDPPFLLILDGVQDPHNLGACLRTADAVGVTAVIVPRDRAAGLSPVVRKVASGAAEMVPLIQVTNLSRTLKTLKDRDIWVVGTDDEAEKTVYDMNLKGPLAVVLGAEGPGLRRLTKENCDVLTKIPMLGGVESLNVSVATGVVLYEALRQRRPTR